MRKGYCFSSDNPSCSMHPNAIEVRNVFGCGQLATIAMYNTIMLRFNRYMYIDGTHFLPLACAKVDSENNKDDRKCGSSFCQDVKKAVRCAIALSSIDMDSGLDAVAHCRGAICCMVMADFFIFASNRGIVDEIVSTGAYKCWSPGCKLSIGRLTVALEGRGRTGEAALV